MQISEILTDAFKLNAYQRILKEILNFNIQKSQPGYEKSVLFFQQISHKIISETLKKFDFAKCIEISDTLQSEIVKIISKLLKLKSILLKYEFLPEYSEKQQEFLENMLEKIVNENIFITQDENYYNIAYFPLIRNLKLKDINSPYEREFILTFQEQKGKIPIPNRIFIKVRSDLLMVCSAISNCDI